MMGIFQQLESNSNNDIMDTLSKAGKKKKKKKKLKQKRNNNAKKGALDALKNIKYAWKP